MTRASFRDTFVTVTVPGHASTADLLLQGFWREATVSHRRCHSFVTVTVPGRGPAGQWPQGATSVGSTELPNERRRRLCRRRERVL